LLAGDPLLAGRYRLSRGLFFLRVPAEVGLQLLERCGDAFQVLINRLTEFDEALRLLFPASSSLQFFRSPEKNMTGRSTVSSRSADSTSKGSALVCNADDLDFMVCLQNEPDCNYATRALNIYDGDHSPRISATECRLTAICHS
jgi:hypothetical protein